MKMKKRRNELESAEERYQAIIGKRNEMNNLGKALRDERDLINQRKHSTIKLVQDLKKERSKLVTLRKEHIKLRNNYQSKAKGLIMQKRSTRKKIYADLPSEVNALKAELKMLDLRQQTTSLSIDAERALIDDIKKKRANLEGLEKNLSEQSLLNKEVKEIDGNIDELFKMGDEEHSKVIDLSGKIDKLHERMSGLVEELTVLNNEADKKHQQYLKMRERADHYHKKSQEMRMKILAIKKVKDTDRREAKALIRKQNKETQMYFDDPDAQSRHDKDALDELKKGKKIKLS